MTSLRWVWYAPFLAISVVLLFLAGFVLGVGLLRNPIECGVALVKKN